MDKESLNKTKEKLAIIKKMIDDLKSEMEEIRGHYKYQNDETRSISEDLIVNYSNRSEIDQWDESIDELINWEEEGE